MNFEPITITADNLEWAVRENMRRVVAALKTKVHASEIRAISGIDADGNVLGGIEYDLDVPTSALTMAGAEALLEE